MSSRVYAGVNTGRTGQRGIVWRACNPAYGAISHGRLDLAYCLLSVRVVASRRGGSLRRSSGRRRRGFLLRFTLDLHVDWTCIICLAVHGDEPLPRCRICRSDERTAYLGG